LLPLGASIGPAGLNVMPYDLTFNGSFFDVADFIGGVDSLLATKKTNAGGDGRPRARAGGAPFVCPPAVPPLTPHPPLPPLPQPPRPLPGHPLPGAPGPGADPRRHPRRASRRGRIG